MKNYINGQQKRLFWSCSYSQKPLCPAREIKISWIVSKLEATFSISKFYEKMYHLQVAVHFIRWQFLGNSICFPFFALKKKAKCISFTGFNHHLFYSLVLIHYFNVCFFGYCTQQYSTQQCKRQNINNFSVLTEAHTSLNATSYLYFSVVLKIYSCQELFWPTSL